MKASEMLARLDQAKEIISSLPPDTSILTVEVDGLGDITGQDTSYIHIKEPIQRLAEVGMIEAGSWETKDDPKQKYIEDSVLIGGFNLCSFRERAAPGAASAEDSGAAAVKEG